MSEQRRRILIIYTGGTIGMISNPKTGSLHPIDFENLRLHVPELQEFDYEILSHQFHPPVDSSDMCPELWARLANIIAEHYERVDGYVILHGTDTMAYTASALSFMLGGLSKPVVLTGSQLPIGMLRTDGKENLINAIEYSAATRPDGMPLVPEVTVCFGQYLYRGNRVTKVSAEGFNAFTSYNFPPLATAGVNIHYNLPLINKPCANQLTPHYELDNSVIVITLFPGILPDIISRVFALPEVRGIVLRTFGSGNAPRQRWLTDAIRHATDEGKTVVNITQCDAGAVAMGLYDTGNQLQQAGVISGGDMTIECAVTKLMYLLGQGLPPSEVRQLMATSLAGEITEDEG